MRSVFLSGLGDKGTVVGVAGFVEGGFVGLGLDDHHADGALLEFAHDYFAEEVLGELHDLLSEEFSGECFFFGLVVVGEHFSLFWHLCNKGFWFFVNFWFNRFGFGSH